MYHPKFKGTHYNIGIKFGEKLKRYGPDFDRIIKLDKFQQDFGKKSIITRQRKDMRLYTMH